MDAEWPEAFLDRVHSNMTDPRSEKQIDYLRDCTFENVLQEITIMALPPQCLFNCNTHNKIHSESKAMWPGEASALPTSIL